MRKFTITSSQKFERTWYDRLETISYSDLEFLIGYNTALNQSANFKYRRIGYFITLLMNKYDRLSVAEKLIERFWKHLNKSDLLQNLFVYGDFDLFKKYWKKNRTDLPTTFLALIFRTDEIDRTKWLLVDKKFEKLIDEDRVTFIGTSPKEKWSYMNSEAYELLINHPKVSELALELKLENIYPTDVKEMFLF